MIKPAITAAPRKRRRAAKWLAGLSLLFTIFLFSASKHPTVTPEDHTYIQLFLKEWQISTTPQQAHASFDAEIDFLSKLQKNVYHSIKHQRIPEADFGHMAYYYAKREGECYDRTVILEKIMGEYGFTFRHVFVYYSPERGTAETKLVDFFKKATLSHAMTEVKTKKGWMAIESNTDCIGLDVNGDVLSVRDIERIVHDKASTVELKTPCTVGLPFWKKYPNFNYLYGIYSRHGQFMKPHLPIPGYNLRSLLYNFQQL